MGQQPTRTPPERYEPLPGIVGLPGHFLRKLSPGGRKVVAALGVLLLAGAVAAAIVLVPRISESKREHAAVEERARARALARERARLVAEQRPRRGRVSANASASAAALVGPIEVAITRDAQARADGGELENRAHRTDCRRLGRDGGRLLLSCTAVTSDVSSGKGSSGVTVGYTYRAAVSVDDGRYAFCKTSARRPVGFDRGPVVELPRACGG